MEIRAALFRRFSRLEFLKQSGTILGKARSLLVLCFATGDGAMASESAKAYENKAIECIAVAETIESPKEKAAMLQLASWWRRLAKFTRGAVKPRQSDSQPAP